MMEKKGKILFVIILLASIILTGCELNQDNMEVLVEGLDTPWAIDFLPDGTVIFTERSGKISIFDGELREIAQLPVSEVSESGLLGIIVDPEFEQNSFVYVYYTYEENDEILNRVSRFQMGQELFNETVLLDNIPGEKFHDGGRIKFGPDNKLYITTGDATNPSSAQDINSLAGKILRMNKDGTIPQDNPFGNYVYSYGHRNPQGLAWRNGVLYSSEHGPRRNDEINIIKKGDNYGWPNIECDGQLRCYSEFTLAPSGIAIHDNNLYVAGLRGAQVRKLELDDKGENILNEEEMITGLGRIRDVVEYQGYLYIATSNKDGRGLPRQNDDKIIKKRLKQ